MDATFQWAAAPPASLRGLRLNWFLLDSGEALVLPMPPCWERVAWNGLPAKTAVA